jgi:hypothetical protein
VVVVLVVAYLEDHGHLGVEARDAAGGEVRAGREREPVAARAVELRERVFHAPVRIGRGPGYRVPALLVVDVLEHDLDAGGGLPAREVEHV